MIEKSPDAKLYEQADSIMGDFSSAVRKAQLHAHRSGVEYTFVANGVAYIACPNGDIEKQIENSDQADRRKQSD